VTQSVTLTHNAAKRVRDLRQALGWTQQELADECQRVGLPWDRSIVANFESRRRAALGVEELTMLALVLTVPPLVLLLPLPGGDSVALAPGLEAEPNDARRWFEGVAALPQHLWPLDPPAARRWRSATRDIDAYRHHDVVRTQLEQAWVTFRANPSGQGKRLSRAAHRYVRLCEEMAHDGLPVPPLSEEMALDVRSVGVVLPKFMTKWA
jgi:transcriptional regulator with XRE-family HTH domain